MPLRLNDFDYELPQSLIAQEPASPRDHSRLLVAPREGKPLQHRRFFELPEYLRSGDVLVVNDTKVIPARIWATGVNGREFELVLIEKLPSGWRCLCRPGKKIGLTGEVRCKDGTPVKLTREAGDMEFLAAFPPMNDFFSWLEGVGEPPLPPYLGRKTEPVDKDRYQTVYARDAGSVAAPTAGLHFTPELLEQLRSQGVEIVNVTLHVGYGTFSPIREENLENHVMHEEWFHVPESSRSALTKARESGRRIFAVGTTSLRTLESIPFQGWEGSTRLFITPGFSFQWAHGLITNFHLPKSTLYVLVCAFLGKAKAEAAYRAAISEKYRFFSYGDAMLIF